MPPPCVSCYHMSPDLMGLTAISTITAKLPVMSEARTIIAVIWHVGGSAEQEKVDEGNLKHNSKVSLNDGRLLSPSVFGGYGSILSLSSTYQSVAHQQS